ncbi:MAG: flagellar hook-associated protein FlgK, partial [Acetobacteraceae bacterium]|nr:flagellar hook-associated protein FlgK [Acetobacteraceae bacterium]
TAMLESETAARDLVRNRLADEAGVNVDQEMSVMVQLQNAYQASARVLQTNRELWDALYQATR